MSKFKLAWYIGLFYMLLATLFFIAALIVNGEANLTVPLISANVFFAASLILKQIEKD